jgi:hypothetical protein
LLNASKEWVVFFKSLDLDKFTTLIEKIKELGKNDPSLFIDGLWSNSLLKW